MWKQTTDRSPVVQVYLIKVPLINVYQVLHLLLRSFHYCSRVQPVLVQYTVLSPPLTYDSDPSDLVHEQRRDDVARQHSQTAQEADHIDDDVILLLEVQVTALLRVEEGGVLQSTFFEFFLPQIWIETETEDGKKKVDFMLPC